MDKGIPSWYVEESKHGAQKPSGRKRDLHHLLEVQYYQQLYNGFPCFQLVTWQEGTSRAPRECAPYRKGGSRLNTKFKNALLAGLLSMHHDTEAKGLSGPSILSIALCSV